MNAFTQPVSAAAKGVTEALVNWSNSLFQISKCREYKQGSSNSVEYSTGQLLKCFPNFLHCFIWPMLSSSLL